MKLKIFSLIAMAIGLLAMTPPAFAGPAASEQLSMPAARDAARAVAWDFARGNPSVNSVKIRSCHREATRRIQCLAVSRGSTSTLSTTCQVWIRVGVAEGRPKASRKRVSCENLRRPLLRASRAASAMRPEGERIGGPEAMFSILGRTSRVGFAGMAAWIRPFPGDPSEIEICKVDMTATLVGEEVWVHADPVVCSLPAR